MSKNMEEFDDRDMTVDITMEDGTIVNCTIETIFSIGDNDYIALAKQAVENAKEDLCSWDV